MPQGLMLQGVPVQQMLASPTQAQVFQGQLQPAARQWGSQLLGPVALPSVETLSLLDEQLSSQSLVRCLKLWQSGWL